MRSSFPCLCLAVVFVSTLRGPACADDTTLENKIERLAQPYIDAERVVGISIGVLKDGEATTAHVGRTSTTGKRPNDDTVYEIGSVSKVFTGILIADAVARGGCDSTSPRRSCCRRM